jgi:hypothetical protein
LKSTEPEVVAQQPTAPSGHAAAATTVPCWLVQSEVWFATCFAVRFVEAWQKLASPVSGMVQTTPPSALALWGAPGEIKQPAASVTTGNATIQNFIQTPLR